METTTLLGQLLVPELQNSISIRFVTSMLINYSQNINKTDHLKLNLISFLQPPFPLHIFDCFH